MSYLNLGFYYINFVSHLFFGSYIAFGIKYDEKWLLNCILKQFSVPFILVKVREGMEAVKGKGVGGKHREFSLVSCSVSPVTLRKCKPSSL